MCERILLVVHGSQLRVLSVRHGGRRGAKHTADQNVAEVPSITHTNHTFSKGASPDVAAEDFLASCGFSTADLPGEPVRWHTAASACNILGKFDRLVFVGDSLTRQVQPVSV